MKRRHFAALRVGAGDKRQRERRGEGEAPVMREGGREGAPVMRREGGSAGDEGRRGGLDDGGSWKYRCRVMPVCYLICFISVESLTNLPKISSPTPL